MRGKRFFLIVILAIFVFNYTCLGLVSNLKFATKVFAATYNSDTEISITTANRESDQLVLVDFTNPLDGAKPALRAEFTFLEDKSDTFGWASRKILFNMTDFYRVDGANKVYNYNGDSWSKNDLGTYYLCSTFMGAQPKNAYIYFGNRDCPQPFDAIGSSDQLGGSVNRPADNILLAFIRQFNWQGRWTDGYQRKQPPGTEVTNIDSGAALNPGQWSVAQLQKTLQCLWLMHYLGAGPDSSDAFSKLPVADVEGGDKPPTITIPKSIQNGKCNISGAPIMTEDMVFTLYAYEIANSDAISTFDLVAAGVAGGVVMKLFPGGLPNKVIAGLTTAAAFVGYSYASRLIQDTDNNVFFHFINKDGKYPAIITVDMDGDVFINLHEFKNGDNFSNDFDYGAGNQTIKESHSKNQLSTNSDYADDNFFKLIVDRTVMPQLNGKCDRHLLYATRDTANTYLNVGSKPKRGRGDPKMIDCLYQKGDGSGSDGAGPDKNGDGWIAHWKLKNLTNYCSVAWVINDMKNTGIGIGLLKMTACIVHSLVSYIFQPDGFPDVLKRLIDSKLIARAPPFEFVFNRQRLLNI